MFEKVLHHINRLTIDLFSSVDILHYLFDDEAVRHHRSCLLMKFLEDPTSLLPTAEHVELERLAQETARSCTFYTDCTIVISAKISSVGPIILLCWLIIFSFIFFATVLFNELMNSLSLVVS